MDAGSLLFWKRLSLALGGALLLLIGLVSGYFLTLSLREQGGQAGSVGMGRGGVSAGQRSPSPAAPLGSDLAALEARAAANPKDVEVLLTLGRAALEGRQAGKAIEAFKKVLDLDPKHPEALTQMGMLLSSGGQVDLALTLFDRALASQPGHHLALSSKGWVLLRVKKDYAGAIKAWEELLKSNVTMEDTSMVAGWIADARQAMAAPSAIQATEGQRARTISGEIRVAPALASKLPAGAVLFIIARRAEGSGPPVAVKRIANPTFPLHYVLGPEDAMGPGGPFEGRLSIIARLKRSGVAGPAEPGDLEGTSPKNPAKIGEQGVDAVLDKLY